MKKKILLLGSSGLIGHQVYNYLAECAEFEIFDLARTRKVSASSILLDMRNEKELDSLVLRIQPHYIINCAGILINGSKTDPENAIFLNAYMPNHLMKLADSIHAKLIHISTDCVFSGKKGCYIESDEKDGTGVYARTKALGEVINDTHLTLRTSVVGPELAPGGEELFHWFMGSTGVINGYMKSIWSGVTTIELAKAVKRAIDQGTTGLYQITNGSPISKYELLKLFKKYSGHPVEIVPVEGVVSDKSFVDTRKEFDYQIPSYEEMIKAMFVFMQTKPEQYAHYLN
jgi:dTDP-4-dehydrorhamnose reductase